MPIGRDNPEPAKLAARQADIQRDLDRMLTLRGPVSEVRRLLGDLDAVAAELARSARDNPTDRHN